MAFSEHTGITMVVLGLLMELTVQFGILGGDMCASAWIVFPLCLTGFVIVDTGLQQLIIHLILSGGKAEGRGGRGASDLRR